MNLKLSIFLILSLALLSMTACSSPSTPPPATPPPDVQRTNLVIAGSGGASTVLSYLADAYHDQHKETTFEFLSGSGSSGGVKGALDGTLDLGVMSRPPKSTEATSGIAYFTFASDQIIFATSNDLSIFELTSQQVRDIFLGGVTNWSEVGGPDAAITVLVRDEEESSTQVLRANLFGEETFVNGSVVFTSEGDLRSALTNASNAIAFMSYGGLRLSPETFPVLAIDGMNPADLNSEYPYFRPLGIAYLPSNASEVQPFLDFIASPDAHQLLAEKGVKPPK